MEGLSVRSGIEVVITGLTRNQFAGNRTRVRIPPAAPKGSRGKCFWSLFLEALKTIWKHVYPSRCLACPLSQGPFCCPQERSGIGSGHCEKAKAGPQRTQRKAAFHADALEAQQQAAA